MKNWFFYKLYVFDKRLFFVILVFCGLTVLCNLRGAEITPFFIWAMYSEKENTQNKYEIFKIQVNDSVIVDYTEGYTDNNRFFLSSPLSYYKKIKQNNFIDPALSFLEMKLGSSYTSIQPLAQQIHNDYNEQRRFPEWYTRYLKQTIGMPIQKLEVEVLVTHFDTNHQLQLDSGYSLLKWEQR